jgi:hypothetical protein
VLLPRKHKNVEIKLFSFLKGRKSQRKKRKLWRGSGIQCDGETGGELNNHSNKPSRKE